MPSSLEPSSPCADLGLPEAEERSTAFQINQPTRCNNFSILLLDINLERNMFRASSRLSSGDQQLQ